MSAKSITHGRVSSASAEANRGTDTSQTAIASNESSLSDGRITYGDVIIAGNGFLTRNKSYSHQNEDVFQQCYRTGYLPDSIISFADESRRKRPSELSELVIEQKDCKDSDCKDQTREPCESQLDAEYKELLEKRRQLSAGDGRRYTDSSFSVTDTLSKVLSRLRYESEDEHVGVISLGDSDVLIDSPFDSGLEGSEDELDVFIANEARLYKEAKLYREIETEIVETVSIIERIGSDSSLQSWQSGQRKSALVVAGGVNCRFVLELSFESDLGLKDQVGQCEDNQSSVKVRKTKKSAKSEKSSLSRRESKMKNPEHVKAVEKLSDKKEAASKPPSTNSFSDKLRSSMRRRRSKRSLAATGISQTQEATVPSAKQSFCFKLWLFPHKEKKKRLAMAPEVSAHNEVSVLTLYEKIKPQKDIKTPNAMKPPFSESSDWIEASNSLPLLEVEHYVKPTTVGEGTSTQGRKKFKLKFWNSLTSPRRSSKEGESAQAKVACDSTCPHVTELPERITSAKEIFTCAEKKELDNISNLPDKTSVEGNVSVEVEHPNSLHLYDRQSVYAPLTEDMDLSSLLDFAIAPFHNYCGNSNESEGSSDVFIDETATTLTAQQKDAKKPCKAYGVVENLRESLHLSESSEELPTGQDIGFASEFSLGKSALVKSRAGLEPCVGHKNISRECYETQPRESCCESLHLGEDNEDNEILIVERENSRRKTVAFCATRGGLVGIRCTDL